MPDGNVLSSSVLDIFKLSPDDGAKVKGSPKFTKTMNIGDNPTSWRLELKLLGDCQKINRQ